jgi:EmrB/QacA subfamily drug resistance transporter
MSTDNSSDTAQDTHRFPISFFTKRKGYHWFVVATVCVGAFMAAVDASIVSVAQPTIAAQFHVSVSATVWIALAYLLTLTAFLTLFGRISDMVGRRPLYTLGFGIFIIGSAAAGAAPDLGFLVVMRVVQGIGACMLQANSVAIITAAVPQTSRGRAIGIQGSALAVGLSLGPAIGGLLIDGFGWRSIFYVNVPVGIIGTTLALLILPRDQMAKRDKSVKRQPFDVGGTALLAIALVTLVLGLNQGNSAGWGSPLIIGYFVVGIVCTYLFFFVEKRHASPLIDLKLFSIEQITWGNISGALSYALMYGVLYISPFFFQYVLKRPAAESGLLTTPLPLGMVLLAPIAGRIADKLGSKIPTVIGMFLATVGCAALALAGRTTSYPYLVVALFLVGVGMGAFTPPNNSAVMGSTPKDRLGVSSGVLNMARSLGQSVGIAYAFAIFEGVILALGYHPETAPIHDLIPGFRVSFIGVGVLGVAALLISAFRGNVEKLEGSAEAHAIEL